VKRLSFRTRVLLYLVLFAVVPSSLLLLGGAAMVGKSLPLLSSSEAWDSVAVSGRAAIAAAREGALTPEQRMALDKHEAELDASLTQARRLRFLASRAVPAMLLIAVVGAGLLALLSTRVAGHLSRQLGRPLLELVGWTELIARGRSLPDQPPKRGAPEFELLRRRMRKMAKELETARERELEAERVEAFRETARRVAHELKNPLTPIRFAVERLRREAPESLSEAVEVIGTESQRLEKMARSFSQFGRLPEGPAAEVDLGELARYTARSAVPDETMVTVTVEEKLPMVVGHHDALSRALTNVLLNAVEACRLGGAITIDVRRGSLEGVTGVVLGVRDTGRGIPPSLMPRLWEPYVTSTPGGTGLGLAIARQTVQAHGGRVFAASREGEWTEIRFVLPLHGEPPDESKLERVAEWATIPDLGEEHHSGT
jgi:signal transduction histidine kinase